MRVLWGQRELGEIFITARSSPGFAPCQALFSPVNVPFIRPLKSLSAPSRAPSAGPGVPKHTQGSPPPCGCFLGTESRFAHTRRMASSGRQHPKSNPCW